MYEQIIAHAKSAIWCIRLDKLQDIFAVLDMRDAGIKADAVDLEVMAAAHRAKSAPRKAAGAIGVLPIIGSIVHRGNMFTEASGTASADVLGRQFDSLVSNQDVGTIVLEIDSPGGEAVAIPELAAKINAARGIKPIVAHVNPEAGSAAYWLASSASEIVCTPSGEVGSIGAYAYHLDYSQQNEMIGVVPTFISYGEDKTEGNSDGPLTDEARAYVQSRVDQIGRQFEADVAKYRGTSAATVHSDWGRGRMLDSEQAKRLGMIDRIDTLEGTLAKIADGVRVKRRAMAERNRIAFL